MSGVTLDALAVRGTPEYHNGVLQGWRGFTRRATLDDLVAALRNKGVGEEFEVSMIEGKGIQTPIMVSPGRYLVVRIDGET